MKIVLATSNPGKVREAQAILGPDVSVEVVPMWLGWLEHGTSFLENARLKAEAARLTLGCTVLAEDSGLEVEALGGRPGIWSARFAGPIASDDDNVSKLLRLMDGVDQRGARYRSVAVLALASGGCVVGQGELAGRIVGTPRGSGGFGYDPVFEPEGLDRTAAELTVEEKSAISHRRHALDDLLVNM